MSASGASNNSDDTRKVRGFPLPAVAHWGSCSAPLVLHAAADEQGASTHWKDTTCPQEGRGKDQLALACRHRLVMPQVG